MISRHEAWAQSIADAISAGRPSTLRELDLILTAWRSALDHLSPDPTAAPRAPSGAAPPASAAPAPAAQPSSPADADPPRPPQHSSASASSRRTPRYGPGVRIYVVTRTNRPQWLGVHLAPWDVVQARLGMGGRSLSGSGIRLRRAETLTEAEQVWHAAGNILPAPVHGADRGRLVYDAGSALDGGWS
jgi:hypothetical protein